MFYSYCAMCGDVCTPRLLCRGRRAALWNPFSPSTLTWAPGIELRLLGFVANVFHPVSYLAIPGT